MIGNREYNENLSWFLRKVKSMLKKKRLYFTKNALEYERIVLIQIEYKVKKESDSAC